MKILAGVHQPDAGEILIDGETRAFARPADALTQGVAMIYQEIVAGAASDRGRKHLPRARAYEARADRPHQQQRIAAARPARCSTTSVSRSTRGRAWGG